jgi:hypothetical protein
MHAPFRDGFFEVKHGNLFHSQFRFYVFWRPQKANRNETENGKYSEPIVKIAKRFIICGVFDRT